jgi:hypothetical protein
MQSLTKLELITARAALNRADLELAKVRGIFLTASYVPGAVTVNTTLVSVHYLIAQIDRELATRP